METIILFYFLLGLFATISSVYMSGVKDFEEQNIFKAIGLHIIFLIFWYPILLTNVLQDQKRNNSNLFQEHDSEKKFNDALNELQKNFQESNNTEKDKE